MKITFKVMFKHDYAKEFGGKLGERIYVSYWVLVNGKKNLACHLSKNNYNSFYVIGIGSNISTVSNLDEAREFFKSNLK